MIMKHNTSWSTPKTNKLKALYDLSNALRNGYNARLIKLYNKDCQYPITVKKNDTDFRNYKSNGALMKSRQEILDDKYMPEIEKNIILNYKGCFGTKEAVEHYYKTGELSDDNLKGIGMSHLVKVTDIIELCEKNGNIDTANRLRLQYVDCDESTLNAKFWYNMISYAHGSQYRIKDIKRKLWVVEILESTDSKPNIPFMVKVLNVLLYPLKFIPERSVLEMDSYKIVSFRIGSVINGIKIEFQLPKKFSFK